MIVDNLKNAHLYYGISERVKLGLEFLKNTDLKALKVGKYEIDGKNVYAVVSTHEGRNVDDGKWEAHKNYMDIQFIVEGIEKMGYSHIANMKVIKEYNEEKDVYFLDGNGDFITVKENNFALFMPEDVHMPNISQVIPQHIKKVVVKVLL